MHTDLDTDMDTDTETTALCPSGSHRASPPGTPTPETDASLLKKTEKLLAGLDRGGPPPAPGAPRRRGSMPVPYKHQLRRAQAIDELDWPPQASSSGSSDSLGSGEAGPTQKDGIFKVMLVGESGVGKSTLAGTFGGLQGDSAHEPENPGIWGSPVRVKGTCGALVRDGRAQGMSSPWRPEPKRNCSSACCSYLPGGGAPGYQVSQVLGSLLTGSIPCPYFPTEDTYERRIMVDKEEVTLVVYDIWEQGDAGGWLRDHCLQTGDAFLIVFSVTDRRSFSKVPETLLRLRAGRPHHDLPVILVGNKSDLARSREVSLEEGRHLAGTLSCKHIETSAALHHNTRELFEGAVRQIRLRRSRSRAGDPRPEWGCPDGPPPPARRESLTKKAKRFLANLVPRNAKFFKQRSRSCHDLSVL
ncbi:GTP-binding protein REM 2 isoform X1 [Mirounga angustirostris]|uniref:GTP-binding protein REM 2 isoform X1 n=1 Tax=Mirounga angustirostris TaxID=9716 RepID=UPI00313C2841